MSEFHYSVKCWDRDGSLIDQDGFTITVKDTDDPEDDRDRAESLASEKSEKWVEDFEGVFEWEHHLVDAS